MRNYILLTKFLLPLLIISTIVMVQPSEAVDNLYITGKITSSSSNLPVSSLWVEIYKSGNLKGRSLSGNDGRYYISGLDKGSYELVIKKGQQEIFRKPVNLPSDSKCDLTI